MAELLGLVGSIIAVGQLTTTVVNYLDGALNASEEVKSLREELTNISRILDQLQERAKLFEVLKIPFPTIQTLLGSGGPLEQFQKILTVFESRLGQDKKGFKQVYKMMGWPLRKEEVRDILASLERYKMLFIFALNNDQIGLIAALKEDFTAQNQKVLDGISKIGVTQNEQERRVVEQEKQDIIAWLSPIDFLQTQSDIFSRHEVGTGQWFLESDEFTQWVAGEYKTLWCPGDPGAGKTFLASISVNYLRQKFNGDNIGVFCVFCNFKEEQLQTINNLLASIWAQSMNTQPSISEAAKSCYTSKHKNKERPDRKDIQELVKAEIGRYSRVFIIVDALDECSDKGNERNVLLTELQNLLSLPIDVQLLLTSRLSINILPHFPSCKTMVISARDEDIKHYVRSRLDQLHDFVQRDKILQEEIVGGISRTAGGMFLLAHLHFESFKDKLTPLEVRLAIEKLPKGNDGLAAAYDQALERIDDQLQGHRDLGNRVLSWVIHACRPLTVEELRYALAMAQHSTVDPGALHDSSNLTAFCAGLVIIGNQDSTVRLVHFTVQSYFEAVRRKRYPDADKLIAETCLKYIDQTLSLYPLSEDEDEELELDFDLEEEISRRMPFFLYSSQEWVYHAYRARDFEHELCDSILRLEDKPIALEVCGLSIWGINMDHYCRGITLLMVAALFGFETTIKKLLERGADVNAETRKHYVLHYAVLGGKPHIVSMLLDNGADVNCQGTKLRTPLHYVLHDERMVRLLLERGADLNMRNQHYKSALHQLLSEWKDRDEWEENWNIKKRPRNAEGEQPLWDIPLDAHYESAMELLLEEWKSKEEVKSIEDVEERLWEVSKLMLGDSKADFERLGPSLLQDAKKWGVPERVKDLIRARMSMEH